jgi:hypothetical protein
MTMMRSFTTFLVLLAATALNPATATYANYRVSIIRGDYDEVDCTVKLSMMKLIKRSQTVLH